MKMRNIIRLPVTLFALCLTAPLATAAPATTAADFTKKLMGAAPGKGTAYACFSRTYLPHHLLLHPKQNVRAMMLLVTLKQDSDTAADGARNYNLRIGAGFRGRKRLFQTEGSCGGVHARDNAGGGYAVHCGVDCDGGAIDVALKDNGSVLLAIPDGVRTESPEDETPGPTRRGSFGADDKLFRLDRASLRQCLPLAADKAERAAMTRR